VDLATDGPRPTVGEGEAGGSTSGTPAPRALLMPPARCSDLGRPTPPGGEAARCARLAGMANRKVEPRPRSDSTSMKPPWSSMSFLLTYRPRPDPPYWSLLGLACENRAKRS